MSMQVYTMSDAGRRCLQRLETEAALLSQLRGAKVSIEGLQAALNGYYSHGHRDYIESLVLIQRETGNPCYGTDGRPVRFGIGGIVNLKA